jgi:AraC-like DNA-binding protein
MKNLREAVSDVIHDRVLPWIERDGISNLLLPEQITPEHCAKPIKCKTSRTMWHREHELGIGLVGEIPYCINGKRLLFPPGRILFLTAGTPHMSDRGEAYYSDEIDLNQPASMIWFAIYPFGLRVQVSHLTTSTGILEINPSYMLLDWHFSRLASDLLDEVQHQPPDFEGIGRAILIEFMHRCLRASTSGGMVTPLSMPTRRWPKNPSAKGLRRKTAKDATKQLPGRVQVAQDFIHSDYNTHITLDDIATAADTSVNHLGRLFKSAIGKTPIQYLLDVRMEAARQLLRTDLKIAEVARLIGIEDAYYFSRAFKRVHGTSPAQYRQQMAKRSGSVLQRPKSRK